MHNRMPLTMTLVSTHVCVSFFKYSEYMNYRNVTVILKWLFVYEGMIQSKYEITITVIQCHTRRWLRVAVNCRDTSHHSHVRFHDLNFAPVANVSSSQFTVS